MIDGWRARDYLKQVYTAPGKSWAKAQILRLLDALGVLGHQSRHLWFQIPFLRWYSCCWSSRHVTLGRGYILLACSCTSAVMPCCLTGHLLFSQLFTFSQLCRLLSSLQQE